jgi:hypothetical protein
VHYPRWQLIYRIWNSGSSDTHYNFTSLFTVENRSLSFTVLLQKALKYFVLILFQSLQIILDTTYRINEQIFREN